MRAIKLGLISAVVLFVLATLLGFLFPSTVLVSRAVDINSAKAPVYAMATDLRRWTEWVAGMKGPTVKVNSATNAQLGNTTVKVIAITDTSLVTIWELANGDKQESTMRFINNPQQPMTVVQWQFVQQLKWYPWERFSSMMNDKIIGTMIEKNLLTLKQLNEVK